LKELFAAVEPGCSKKDIETFLKLLSPICPHLAEEFWERIGNKPFASVQPWPKADESKIDPAVEATASTAQFTMGDARDILKLLKIANPKQITLIVSAAWKYDFIKKLKSELEKTYDVGALIKATLDKEHASDISKLVPKLIKDRSKIPDIVTSQAEEIAALEQNKQLFTDEFKAEIIIIKAEDTKEPKAKNAMPGKPAILVE
jgi:leucyl-tRNA synthetase